MLAGSVVVFNGIMLPQPRPAMEINRQPPGSRLDVALREDLYAGRPLEHLGSASKIDSLEVNELGWEFHLLTRHSRAGQNSETSQLRPECRDAKASLTTQLWGPAQRYNLDT